MGCRRQRLIVQADLTSEEDQVFLAWVKEQRKRRKLGEQVRLGLRLQYEQLHGRTLRSQEESALPAPAIRIAPVDVGGSTNRPDATNKLQRLVGSF